MNKQELERRLRSSIEVYVKYRGVKQTKESISEREELVTSLDIARVESDIHQMLLMYSLLLEDEELKKYKDDKEKTSKLESFSKLVDEKFGVTMSYREEESNKELVDHVSKNLYTWI